MNSVINQLLDKNMNDKFKLIWSSRAFQNINLMTNKLKWLWKNQTFGIAVELSVYFKNIAHKHPVVQFHMIFTEMYCFVRTVTFF